MLVLDLMIFQLNLFTICISILLRIVTREKYNVRYGKEDRKGELCKPKSYIKNIYMQNVPHFVTILNNGFMQYINPFEFNHLLFGVLIKLGALLYHIYDRVECRSYNLYLI